MNLSSIFENSNSKIIKSMKAANSLGVSNTKLASLTLLAVSNAISEGVGVAFIFPILFFIENGVESFTSSTNPLINLITHVSSYLGINISLPFLLAICLSPILIKQLFFYLLYCGVADMRKSVATTLRKNIFERFLQADLSYIEHIGTGKPLSSLTLESERAAQSAVFAFFLFWSIGLIISYSTVLIFLSWQLTLLAACLFLLIELVIKKHIKFSFNLGNEVSTKTDQYSMFVQEKIGSSKFIKSSHSIDQEQDRMGSLLDNLLSMKAQIEKRSALVQATVEPILVIGSFGVLLVAISVFNMKLANLGLFLFILMRIMPITKLANNYRHEVASFVPAFNSINTFLCDLKKHTTIRSGEFKPKDPVSTLELKNVSFNYKEDVTVLKDISFNVFPNTLTVILGKSGSGKSTIADLVLRLRTPESGNIYLNSRKIEDYDTAYLRDQIGIVSQHSTLFNMSIRDNITYGRTHVNDAEINEAMQFAHADIFVSNLPNGLDTIVTDRGANFSGGEKQRLCFARALINNHPILIFDEPTSSLDYISERMINESIMKLKGKKTMIMITHRLAHSKNSDQVIIIENGRIKEQGRPSDLMENGGIYSNMCHGYTQAALAT